MPDQLPPPDTRIVGDGYVPGTDALLHFTVQGRDGKRITAWRQGAGWSAGPEPRSIDEIAAEPAPPAAGELPTGPGVWGHPEWGKAWLYWETPDSLVVQRIDKRGRVGHFGYSLFALPRGGWRQLTATAPDPGCFAGGDAGICLHAEASRERVRELEAKLSNLPKSMAQLFDERDALTAKLADAERERDNLSFLLRDTVANVLSAPEILSDTPDVAADKLTAGWDAMAGRVDADSQKFGVAYLAWRERVLKLNNGQFILPGESQEEFEAWLSRAEWGNADDELTELRDRVAALRGALEKLVVNLSDALKWNWTFQGLSKRDAADQVLATMVEVGLIEGWQHPMSFGGTGYSTYRINGRLYGRTDEPNGAPALAPEAPNGN